MLLRVIVGELLCDGSRQGDGRGRPDASGSSACSRRSTMAEKRISQADELTAGRCAGDLGSVGGAQGGRLCTVIPPHRFV